MLNRFTLPGGADEFSSAPPASVSWASPQYSTVFEVPPGQLPPLAIPPIPGSKSQSNRFLLLAALAPAPTRLHGVLKARDTQLMQAGLEKLGAGFTQFSDGSLLVDPIKTNKLPKSVTIACGLAGTVMRFLPAVAAGFHTPVTFTADRQANQRPLRPLLDALQNLGAKIDYAGENLFPFTITGPLQRLPQMISINAAESSQFLSALLLALPWWQAQSAEDEQQPKTIQSTNTPSMPHVEMTVEALRSFGFPTEVTLLNRVCSVNALGKKLSTPGEIHVEPDLTTALPFLASPAFTGRAVTLKNWPTQTTQPLVKFLPLLEKLGIATTQQNHQLTACKTDPPNHPQTLLMRDFGELIPVVAALATQLPHPTTFTGLVHLRGHETDRLQALQTELHKLGGRADTTLDTLTVHPLKNPRTNPIQLHTYQDHRMVMFAALLGLKYPVIVADPATVSKTFPDFIQHWETLFAGGAHE